MYAVEFETIVNEPYVKIPEFERFKGHKLKVILLDTEDCKDEKKGKIPSKRLQEAIEEANKGLGTYYETLEDFIKDLKS